MTTKRGRPTKPPTSVIGKRVEARRLELGLARKDLAEACEVSEATLSYRLTAGNFLACDVVPLAKVLAAPVEWILTGRIPGTRRRKL